MREQLIALREAMKAKGVDFYLIPTDDFHASEYVGEYFKCRAWISGFTGSAGTLIVGTDWAGLWTDGRYFLQAADQLSDSGIELMKMGEPGVWTVTDYLALHLSEGQTLGFDGRCVTTALYQNLEKLATKKGAKVNGEMDLVGMIWTNRPERSAEPVFELPVELTGQERADKIRAVREELLKKGVDTLILSSLSDICWLLNIRGADVANTPVVLSFALVEQKTLRLYLNPVVLSEEIRSNLEADGVEICTYGSIYEGVNRIPAGSTVQLNPNVVNSRIYAALPDEITLVTGPDPTELPKAVKNPTEVANMRVAHIKDGLAMTRFMRWLKANVGREAMSELSLTEKLEFFRSSQEDYLGPSFRPIIGYGPHGAIVHYSVTPESSIPVEPRSFLLVDSGGHYRQGTTDITRTFAMGALTQEEKEGFTLVLRSHLRMSAVNFRYGCTGINLDMIARAPFWDQNLDFNHGTGHGVGYLLSVHEGPQGIRWQSRGKNEAAVFEPGMICSNEPGLYLTGKFGIRHENMVVCCEGVTNSYGRFLHFENLTMVPWDLDAVLPELLEPKEREILNTYHKEVYAKLSPYLDEDEKNWLAHATREI